VYRDEKNQLKVEFFLLSIDDHKRAVQMIMMEVEWAERDSSRLVHVTVIVIAPHEIFILKARTFVGLTILLQS
jgi:hypothetical protein